MTRIPAELMLTPEQVNIWFARIKRAYTSRAWVYNIWQRLKDYRKGNYYDELSDMDRVTGSWHLVHIRQMAAQLYFQNARINVFPKSKRAMDMSKPVEKLISYERQVIKSHKAEREALFNNLWYGTGILKFAWNAEHGMEFPESDRLSKRILSSVTSPGQRDAAYEDAIMPLSELTEHSPNVIIGHPWVGAVHPMDFLVDADALTFEEARFFIHRFRRPWISVINDKRYDTEARKSINPEGFSKYYVAESMAGGEGETDWRNDTEKRDSAMCTLYEIFDRTTLTVTVLSDACERPLKRELFPWFGRRGPYVVSKFIECDDSFWGYPYAETFTPQAQAVNLMRSQMMDHIQRYGYTRMAYMKNAVNNKDELDAFVNSKRGEAIGIEGDKPIGELIHAFPAINLAADVYKAADIFKQDMQEISGVTENQLGGGTGVQTATEASIVEQKSTMRTGDMRFIVDDMVRESTRTMMRLLKTFWGAEEVIPVVGDGGQLWEISGKTLNFEFDVDVEPGSTERTDRSARMRQAIELLRESINITPMLAQQNVNVQLGELYKLVLENSDIVKNASSIVPDPGVTPMGGEPMMPPEGLEGMSQMMAAQAQAPAAVNARGNVVNARESFQSGRRHSENARR